MLKAIPRLLIGFFILIFSTTSAQKIIKTDNGVIVYPNPNMCGETRVIKLQVVNDRIIRITASPRDTVQQNKSLIAIYQPAEKTNFTTKEFNDSMQLKTNALSITVNRQTGAV